MRAVVAERMHGPLVIRELPIPSIVSDEVLIRVRAAGVCHFDKLLMNGFLHRFRIDPFPRVLGHEVAGTVERVGDDVTQVRVGDRVCVARILACGKCHYCRIGEEECCVEFMRHLSGVGVTWDGGFEEYMKAPAHRVVRLPEELSFEDAVPFCCAGLSVYTALKNAGVHPGQRVAVLDIDGFGSLAVPIATAMGADVFAVMLSGQRISEVERLGPKAVLAGYHLSSGRQLLERGGVNVALCTDIGSQDVESVLSGITPQGTLILTGVSMQPVTILPALLISTQLRIMGTSGGSKRELEELLAFAVQHNIRPVIERYPLEEIHGVFDRLRRRQLRFHAVLTP